MAFTNNLRRSHLHIITGSSAQLHPATCYLFKAFVNADPAPKRQRAITQKMLQGMYTLAGLDFPELHDTPTAVVADLAMEGLFFDICNCARTQQVLPFWTKTSTMHLRIIRVSLPSPSTLHSCLRTKRIETRTLGAPKNEGTTPFFALSEALHH